MEGQKTINLVNKTLDLLVLTDIPNKDKIKIADNLIEIRKEAINYTPCCESDSEGLKEDIEQFKAINNSR